MSARMKVLLTMKMSTFLTITPELADLFILAVLINDFFFDFGWICLKLGIFIPLGYRSDSNWFFFGGG